MQHKKRELNGDDLPEFESSKPKKPKYKPLSPVEISLDFAERLEISFPEEGVIAIFDKRYLIKPGKTEIGVDITLRPEIRLREKEKDLKKLKKSNEKSEIPKSFIAQLWEKYKPLIVIFGIIFSGYLISILLTSIQPCNHQQNISVVIFYAKTGLR